MLNSDIGTMDKDGYVKIVGRIKEMIIRGGANVYPREVEELLHQHPNILVAAVMSVYHLFHKFMIVQILRSVEFRTKSWVSKFVHGSS